MSKFPLVDVESVTRHTEHFCSALIARSLLKNLWCTYKKTRSVLAYLTTDVFNAVECMSILLGCVNIIMWIDIVVQSKSLHVSER